MMTFELPRRVVGAGDRVDRVAEEETDDGAK
jgi:hypothetical protein